MSLFSQSNANKFITHTPLPLKTKPRGRFEVVQDENEDTSVIDEAFQVIDDSLFDVDAEELNVALSSSGLANVNEDDDNHIEDCDGANNNSIDDEDENSD